jgi:hypothetical protein
MSVSENPVVGPRASGLVTGKDGEAGDIGVYRRCSRTQSSRKTSRSKPDRILRQAPRLWFSLILLALSGCGMFRSELPTQADPLQNMDLSRARLALPQDEAQRQELPLGVFTGVQVGDARVTLESQLQAPEGVLVTGIIENSPAIVASIQEGDILLEAALNENEPMPLQWPSDWYRLEQTASSESSIHVLFDRAGRDG